MKPITDLITGDTHNGTEWVKREDKPKPQPLFTRYMVFTGVSDGPYPHFWRK